LFENSAGATIDLLIELVASTFLAGGILFLSRDPVAAGASWFLVPVGTALVALEVSRILRGRCAYSTGRVGGWMLVDTTSVPYFVADALLVALGAVWLVHTFVADPGLDPRTQLDFGFGVPTTFLAVALGLLGIRIWAVRDGATVGDRFPEDLAGAVLDFFLQAVGLFLVAVGGVDVYEGIVRGDLRAGLLALAAGVALLGLVVRRIVRGGYVLNKDKLPITVSTVSVPYFVSDALFLGFGAVWLYHAPGPIDRPWFVGGGMGTGTATAFVAPAAALLFVRVWSRLRARH
jgi:hypothetical protein